MIDSVLLIRPKAVGKMEFPFGLLYVGTALKQAGFQVKIIDLQDNLNSEDDVIEILKFSPATILGINALAPHYRWVKEFTLKLKNLSPATKIVVGGHIAVVKEIILSNTGADIVCLGEGEEVFPEIIEKINRNKNLEGVLGIAYKQDGQTKINSRRPYVQSFLMPDYDLIDVNRYLIHPTKDFFFNRSPKYNKRAREDDKLGAVMFSRGCVGGCGFCYRHLPGFRQASIDWSWNHLKYLHDKHGIKYFRIDDELFANNFEWFNSFYRKVLDSKIDILFRITGLRVDSINDNLLKMLDEMGCIAINYGIESGSQTILDRMNKRTKVEQNIQAIKKTQSYGMQAMAYVIFGYQGENLKTLNETLDCLLKSDLPPEYLSIFYAVALPGTKLYWDCLKEGKIKDEEKYLIDISSYIFEKRKAHEYYFINFTELDVNTLVKWEKLMILMLELKMRLRNHELIFSLLKKIILILPANEEFYKFILRFSHLVSKLKKIIDNKKRLSGYDHFLAILGKIIIRFPAVGRRLYLAKCRKILSGHSDDKIIILSFDCDNQTDIGCLRQIADFLDKQNIKASFAAPGEILTAGESEFINLFKKGHDFIVHGYKQHSEIINSKYISTFYYDKLSDDELEDDMIKGNGVFRKIFKVNPKGFRIPHFGHSNTKRELRRVYKILNKEGVLYSSSTLPLRGILKGPLYKTDHGITELPITGLYDKPLGILDTYSYGFSRKSEKYNFTQYLTDFKKLIDNYGGKKIVLNMYCDPSQAVQMREWFLAIAYAIKNNYKFMTLGDFYERYK